MGMLCFPVCAGRLIEEPLNLELLVREDVALQQLVLASMGSNPLVVQQAVKIMSAVGAYAGAAKRLVKHNVVRAITGMLASGDKVSRGVVFCGDSAGLLCCCVLAMRWCRFHPCQMVVAGLRLTSRSAVLCARLCRAMF